MFCHILFSQTPYEVRKGGIAPTLGYITFYITEFLWDLRKKCILCLHALGIIVYLSLYLILMTYFYMKAFELCFMTQMAKPWMAMFNLVLLLNGHDCFMKVNTVSP